MVKKKLDLMNKIKERTFVYFNIVSEDIVFSESLGNLVLLINTLQILGLIFQIGFLEIKSLNIVGDLLHQIFNIFLPLLLSNETSINLIFSFSYWFFLGYVIFQISYIILMFKTMKKYESVRFDSYTISGLFYYKYINVLFIYVFFLPHFSLCCFGIKCLLSSNENYINNQTFNQIYLNKCDFFTWPLLSINLIQLFVILGLQFTHTVLLFNTETQLKNSLAYSYSPFHTFYLIYQIFLVILLFSGSYYFIFNIIVFILQCILFFILLNHHVFHNPKIEKMKIVLLSGEMIITVYFEICGFVETYSNIKEIYCFNVVLILIYIKALKIVGKFYENYIENLLTLDVTEIFQDSLLDKKIKFYFFYIMNQEIHLQSINYKFTDYPSFLIRGFEEFHREHCKFPDCLCKNKKDFFYDYSIRGEYIIDKEKPSNNLNNLIYIKHLLMNIYYVFSGNKRKKSLFLRINMAAFLFYQLKNFHKAVVECIDIKTNSHPHILHEMILFRLMRDIDKFQFNLDRNKWDIPEYSVLDFTGLMRIEDDYLLLKNEIKNFIGDYINFLTELTEDHPNINHLETSSKKLFCKRMTIDKIFRRNEKNPVSIHLYMEYLSNLIFSDDLRQPFEKEYNEKIELILTNQSNGKVFFELDLMYNEDSIILQMGSSKGNLGHIIKANEGMAKFVGYTIAELEFSNINILMPERIAENHDRYLLTFMESSKGNVIYRERKIFARNKVGYIQFLSILMKPVFDYSQDIFKFVGYLQPFSSGIEFAVVDENGFIDSISKGLGLISNMVPENFESKKLLIQSISPNLAEIFLEKQMDEEMRKDKTIQRLMSKIKGPKLENGDYICKVYPYIDGVEDFRLILDKISYKIQKKEYRKIAEYMEEFIYYKEMIEDNIPNNCTFILQASTMILYSQDKTLELNIFCFKEVDSIYLEIPQQAYGSNSNIFKNLDYYLLIKQSLGKKKFNKSLSKDEIERMGTISFYNSTTMKSILSQNEFGDIDNKSKNIYEESDDVSIHMNKKLDEIFVKKVKTKEVLDFKTEKLRQKSLINKQLSKQLGSMKSKNYSSKKSIIMDENPFESLKQMDETSEERKKDESQKKPEEILNNYENDLLEFEENDEEKLEEESDDKQEFDELEEKDRVIEDRKKNEAEYKTKPEMDEEEDEDDAKNKENFEDLRKSHAKFVAKREMNYSSKNNSSISVNLSRKGKKFVNMFKKNITNFRSSKMKTLSIKENNIINLNEKNQIVKGQEDQKDQESDHQINRNKEKKFEAIKKKNNMLFHDGQGSSVGSSTANNVQARKMLRESIQYNYIPISFKKIILLFSLSTILIFISQAISTIYFQYSINQLSISLKADQNYNEISFYMMRISNSFYKLLLMQEDLMYSGLNSDQKDKVFIEFKKLVELDSNELVSNLKYLESNYNLFKDINDQMYLRDTAFELINNTVYLKIIKSIFLFLTNSMALAKGKLSDIHNNNNGLYFILKNINNYLSFFEKYQNFDQFNRNIIASIKNLMFTIFGLTCGALFVMFVVRIVLYKKCYEHVNELFVMLGSIPNEDLNTLQRYLKTIKIVFENTFVNIKIDNNDNNDHQEKIEDVNQNKIWQNEGDSKDLKNQRGVLQRRTKFYKNIEFPLTKILLINIIWYLVFFLGYIGLLGLSSIFDNTLDNLIHTRAFIREDQYIYSAKALLYAMDYIYLKTNSTSSSFINVSTSEYFYYFNNDLPKNLDYFSISSGTQEDQYTIMHNTSICSSISSAKNDSSRFFSQLYCNNLLGGVLNIGIMPFLKNFYTCLAQINLENTTFSKEEIIEYLNTLKFTDFSEGLEYMIWPLENFHNEYQSLETTRFDNKVSEINVYIILELFSIIVFVLVYWIGFLRPMKQRLVYCRKCFFHIPFAVLNQQVRILKYINSTGNLLLKKK